MGKNTDIGPNNHSPCVESTPPHRISPEDLSFEEVIPEDAPTRKNAPEETPLKESPGKNVSSENNSSVDERNIKDVARK